MRNDNDEADYAEDAGRIRRERSIERQLAACPRDYPPELHRQDVMSRNGIDEQNENGSDENGQNCS